MINLAAARTMTQIATVWPVGADSNGYPTVGTPYTIKCNHVQGGKLTRDANGEEFVPSDTFRTLDARPQRGDSIATGDLTANAAPTGAQQIRKAGGETPFAGIPQSRPLLTG